LVALGALLLALRPAAAQEPDPRSLLVESLEPRVPGYVGVQVTDAGGQGAKRRGRVFRKGHRLLVRFEGGQILFDDGESQSLYLPRRNTIEKSPSRQSAQQLRAQRQAVRSGRAAVRLVGREVVAGRPAFVLQIRMPNGTERQVWVDERTSVQLRQDQSGPGEKSHSTYFTEIRYQEPSEEDLAFPPPGSNPVVRETGDDRPVPLMLARRMAQRWGGLLLARYVPAGYRLRGFYRHQVGPREWLVAAYQGPPGAGPRPLLSLFQGPAEGMGAAELKKQGLLVLAGTRGRADVLLVAPLPQAELQKVMDSVTAE
jgi:hypothetical protein